MYNNKTKFKMGVISLSIILMMIFGGLSGCNSLIDNKNSKPQKQVELTIAFREFQTWPAMEKVINMFEKKYTNCTIKCEYIQGDETIIERRLDGEESKIDIFTTSNIQETTNAKIFLDNCVNLLEKNDYLDLSETNAGLVDNFKLIGGNNELYSIPYGGEMRGMYVNKTLLQKYNLTVPKNRTELLNCFEILLNAGYVPLQSSTGTCAQQLLYPSICNKIVHGDDAQEIRESVEQIKVGTASYFEDEISFLYDIVQKGYFDYKRVESEFKHNFGGAEGKARDFLNVMLNADKTFEKVDDIGQIAFLPDTQAFEQTLDKVANMYNSDIEYEFILSPVSDDGGFAYLSPSNGLAINNKSDNIDWSLKFLNFFFDKDVSKVFAEEQGCIANSSDALVKFNVADDRVTTVGEVTFDNYKYTVFYKTLTVLMTGGYSDASYNVVNAQYISKNLSETYYYLSDSNNNIYNIADEAYRLNNPDAVLYRKNEEMVGISKMNNEKYMNKDSYYAVDAEYRTNNPLQVYYYLDGEEYKSANASYLTANPNIQYYRANCSLKYSLQDYMDRLEEEFGRNRDSK